MMKTSAAVAVGATALSAALAPLSAAHAASPPAPVSVTVPVTTTTHTEWVGLDPLGGGNGSAGNTTVCAFGSCSGVGGGAVMAMATVTVTTPDVAWGNPASLVDVRVMPGPWNCAGGAPTPTTGTLTVTPGATVTPILGETQVSDHFTNAAGTAARETFTAALFTPAADGVAVGAGNCAANGQRTSEINDVYTVQPAAGHGATVSLTLTGGGYTGHTVPLTIPAAGAATPSGATLTVRPALASRLTVGLSLDVQASGALSLSQAEQLAAASGVQGAVHWTGTGGAVFTPGPAALSVAGNLAQWTDLRAGQAVTVSAAVTATHPAFNVFGPNGTTFMVDHVGQLSLTDTAALQVTLTAPPPIIKTVTQTITHTVPGPTRTVTVTKTVPGPTRTVVHTVTKIEREVQTRTLTLSLAADSTPASGRWVPVTVRLDPPRGAAWQLVQLAARGPRGTRVADTVLTATHGVARGRVWVPAGAQQVTVTATDGSATATLALHPHTAPTAPWPWWWVVLAAVGLAGAAGWTQSVWKRPRGLRRGAIAAPPAASE